MILLLVKLGNILFGMMDPLLCASEKKPTIYLAIALQPTQAYPYYLSM